MRLATLNVLSMRDPKGLASALQAHLPIDVLALQEVGRPEAAHAFAASMNMRVAVLAVGDAKVCLCNALLVRLDEPNGASSASYKLFHPRESRAAVSVTLPRLGGAEFICTHLDHRDEDVRLQQLASLRAQHAAAASDGAVIFYMGDFNSLRRSDYTDAAWGQLVKARSAAQIESETRVSELLEHEWKLADCRTAAASCLGSTPTSVHGCRIDYIWASAGALAAWRVTECLHVWLKKPPRKRGQQGQEESESEEDDDDDSLTDHALVICTLERTSTAAE